MRLSAEQWLATVLFRTFNLVLNTRSALYQLTALVRAQLDRFGDASETNTKDAGLEHRAAAVGKTTFLGRRTDLRTCSAAYASTLCAVRWLYVAAQSSSQHRQFLLASLRGNQQIHNKTSQVCYFTARCPSMLRTAARPQCCLLGRRKRRKRDIRSKAC